MSHTCFRQTKPAPFVGFWLVSLFAASCFVNGMSGAALAQLPTSEAPSAGSLDEQTIYVPYDKLREVFERDGRGVFLPYEKFRELWDAARANQPAASPETAPLGALLTDIESVATLGKQVVNVDAKVRIELLKSGWHRIPLRLEKAAIRRATIDGEAARIISSPDGQHELLVSHATDEAKTITLELSYAKALEKNGGQSVVAFRAPQSPVNRWTIRTGQKDIDVQIEPMIASSKRDDTDAEEGGEILAFVGAAAEVKIKWTPKAEGASGLSALVSANTVSQFQIDQGVARTSANVTLDISRAEVANVSLEVPSDQKVVSVFDRNVRKWNVKKSDDSQTIEVELFEPALGRQSLQVRLEKYVDEMDDASLTVPQIKFNDVSVNSGTVLVALSPGLRAEPEQKLGLRQLDVSKLPGELAKQDWGFAYRYAAVPYQLLLKVKTIQPQIRVKQLVELTVLPETLNVDIEAVYDVQLAGVFRVELDVPEGFEIRDVRPLSRNGLLGIPVDGWDRDAEDKRLVTVTLGKKALGKFGVVVSLEQKLNEAALLNPADDATKIATDVPKARLDGLDFSEGHLVVYSPKSLQVNAVETKGLQNESFSNALKRQRSSVKSSEVRPLLAYRFSHTPASIELSAKRRLPQVTVDQVVVATVQSGVVKYDARLFYDVLYSNVKSLRLDVPTELVDQLRSRSPNVRKQELDPQPDDIADGYTAWELTSDREFFGEHEVRYVWERKLEDLPLGQSIELVVDRLAPAQVDRAGGQVVLTKSETIGVRPGEAAEGLLPIDPQTDLKHGVKVENAAMAFEFVDDWTLPLVATRFELQELKRTSVSRAVVRAVVLRQNELSVQCLYQIRSLGQRLSIQMPAGFDATTSFDDQPIRINGRSVTPERGGQDLIHVPLTGLASEAPFLLEVRYTVPGGPQQIDLPQFPDSPAVQKVYLCVYLPFEQAAISKDGPWTDEAIDQHAVSIAAMMRGVRGERHASRIFRRRGDRVKEHLEWVRDGVGDVATSQTFEVDGRPYVFSSLRPDPAPVGSLQLRTMNVHWLNALVCGLVGVIGLLLVRLRFRYQLMGGLLIIASLFLISLFFPLVAEHLFGGALLLTLVAVATVWLMADLGRWWRDVKRRRVSNRVVKPVATDPPPDEADPESEAEETTGGEE